MTTIMRPFQCDLQPEIQETHRTTHTGTTTRCRTQKRNQFAHETTAAATAAHTRYLSSPAAATSHGKTQGFVLWLHPQNKAHATFMQPSQCASHLPRFHVKRRWIKVVPRLPRKVPRRPGRHGRPSQSKRATQCHECHACHAKRWWM